MGGGGGERNRVLSSRGRGARLEFYRGAFLGHSWGSRTLPSSSSGTDFVNTCFQGISPPTPKTVGEARRRLPHVSACHHFRTSRAQSLVWAIRYQLSVSGKVGNDCSQGVSGGARLPRGGEGCALREERSRLQAARARQAHRFGFGLGLRHASPKYLITGGPRRS